MAAKLIEVFNNCKCVGEEQHLAAGEVRSLAFGDNRSVMVIELGLHEVVKRDTLAKAEKQLASAYGLDRVCIEPRYELPGELPGEYIRSLYDDMAARMPSAPRTAYGWVGPPSSSVDAQNAPSSSSGRSTRAGR